jgi:hypothetical protein
VADYSNHYMFADEISMNNDFINSFTLNDVNNDGIKDIIVLTQSGNIFVSNIEKMIKEMIYYEKQEEFISPGSYNMLNLKLNFRDYIMDKPKPAKNTSLTIRDIDQDRKWDLIYISDNHNLTAINQAGEQIKFFDLPCSSQPLIKDLDNDGNYEIICSFDNQIYLAKIPYIF